MGRLSHASQYFLPDFITIQLITNDAWGDSEGESDELDFESDPLDREQKRTDLASDMSSAVDDAQEESMDATANGSTDEDEIMSDSNGMPNTTATPFDPLPFSHPIGPISLLESVATPFDFSLFFDNDILDHIVDQTNLYTTQKPPSARYKWHPTCSEEIKLFLGMIIAMGVHRLPNSRTTGLQTFF